MSVEHVDISNRKFSKVAPSGVNGCSFFENLKKVAKNITKNPTEKVLNAVELASFVVLLTQGAKTFNIDENTSALGKLALATGALAAVIKANPKEEDKSLSFDEYRKATLKGLDFGGR